MKHQDQFVDHVTKYGMVEWIPCSIAHNSEYHMNINGYQYCSIIVKL